MTLISEIGGEKELIHRIEKIIPKYTDEVILGIGDDAAITIPPKQNKNIVHTTDMLVENSHFSLKTHTSQQIGKKAAVSNISDIAAMGATPKHMLVSLAIPKNTTIELIEGIYEGMKQETEKYNINIIGGNITGSKDQLIINICLTGEIEGGKELRRSTTTTPDIIMVTGNLGDSGAGLYCLMNEPDIPKKISDTLKARHLNPTHRLEESHILRDMNTITSANDISDGLATEIKEICDASNVGAIIQHENIPTSPENDILMEAAGKDTKQAALYAGEDYELVFTAKKEDEQKIKEALNKIGTKVTTIGTITEEKKIIMIKEGKQQELTSSGYDHFRDNEFDYRK